MYRALHQYTFLFFFFLSYKLLNPKIGFTLTLEWTWPLHLPTTLCWLLHSYNYHIHTRTMCTRIIQIHISFHNAYKWAETAPFLIQLGKGWAWYKRRFQFLHVNWVIWMVFPEFLKKGFHWHGSKWLNGYLTWNIWLTSYRCCATRFIVLHII